MPLTPLTLSLLSEESSDATQPNVKLEVCSPTILALGPCSVFGILLLALYFLCIDNSDAAYIKFETPPILTFKHSERVPS